MRPQVGLGYCASMLIFDDGDMDWWYSTCPCSDWQPSGIYQQYEEYQFADGRIDTTEITGTAAQGLCIGTETKIVNVSRNTYTFTTEYDDSGRIGETWIFPFGGGTEDPALLERIWW